MADFVLYSALLGSFLILLIAIHTHFLPTLESGVAARLNQLKTEVITVHGPKVEDTEVVLSVVKYGQKIHLVEITHRFTRILLKASLGFVIIILVIQFVVTFLQLSSEGLAILDLLLAVGVVMIVIGILPPFLKGYS